jgi:peptidoglycan/xylan/chitin deacetylase (PgdA/CDA1 family)
VVVTPHHVPVGWPESKKLAVFVNVMLEAWSDNSAPGVGPMGNPLKVGYLDTQARSWAEYGPSTGILRILDILRKKKVRATIFTSGIIAEKRSALVKQISTEGHELAAHSYAQDILPIYLDESADKQNIEKCKKVLLASTGKSPKGWCSPRCTPGLKTAENLSELGFTWHVDAFNADLPYVQDVNGKSLAAIPFTTEVNDMPLYIRYGNMPHAYTQILKRILDKWYDTHDEVGCLDVTVHAHVFGRPFGAIEFEEALKTVKSLEWIWFPTHDEMARLFFET